MPLSTYFCPLSHFFLIKKPKKLLLYYRSDEVAAGLLRIVGLEQIHLPYYSWMSLAVLSESNYQGHPKVHEAFQIQTSVFWVWKSCGWWNASPLFRELKSPQIQPASGYNGQQNWTAAMFYMRKFCCLGSRRGENDELCSECHGTANTVGKHEVICHLMCQGKCLFDAPRISVEEAGWNWFIYYNSSLEASLWLRKTFPGQERQNISYQGRNSLLNKPLGRDLMRFQATKLFGRNI